MLTFTRIATSNFPGSIVDVSEITLDEFTDESLGFIFDDDWQWSESTNESIARRDYGDSGYWTEIRFNHEPGFSRVVYPVNTALLVNANYIPR